MGGTGWSDGIVTRLGSGDIALMRQLNAMFAAAFEDDLTYSVAPPSDEWLSRQLARPDLVVLAAIHPLAGPCGGLVAHVLPKLEQERSEIYIYDLAVASDHRRQGVATALINWLQAEAKALGAHALFVQADYSDPPAIALYEKLGDGGSVLHFDMRLPDA